MPRIKGQLVTPKNSKKPPFVHYYTPDGPWQGWKKIIMLRAKPYVPREPLSGPLRVWADVFFSRPEYMQGKKYSADPLPHFVKPDRDNVEKAILDAFTTIGFWCDDAQVCGGEVCKWYCAKGGKPGASFIIERMVAPAGDLFQEGTA
jgi:Holliday junction resolvase RusA-like endonuclease